MSLLSKTISQEKVTRPRLLVSGVIGIGKTTLAATAENVVFVSSERGLEGLEHIPRFSPQSAAEVKTWLDEVIALETIPWNWIALDTLDWLERSIYLEVCAEGKCASIEEYAGGYGKGYTRAREKLDEILQRLEILNLKRDVGIIILAHVQAKLLNPPGGNSYNSYTLKGNEKFTATVKEWCDALLFANYEMFSKGKKEEKQAIMGERKLYTTPCAAYEAKNRYGLPEELPLDWSILQHHIAENRRPRLIERITALLNTSTLSDEMKKKQLAAFPTLSPDRLRAGIAFMESKQQQPAA